MQLSSQTKLFAISAAAAAGAYLVYRLTAKPKPSAADDAKLVRGTWAAVAGDLQGAGDLFYKTLFEMEPSLKTGIFGKSDMKVQPLRLMQMVDGAIKLLDQPDVLIPTLLKLGERHLMYGTEPAHYVVVGQALIKTLKAALGPKMTPEATAAWIRIYGVIQDTMIKGTEKAAVRR
jgi:methyl-accepting chemotaxis protein